MQQDIANIKELADSGDPWAMIRYADYLRNENPTKNAEQAAYYYKNASFKGNYIAMNRYATMLRFGEGIQKNKSEAILYYKMAVDEDDPCSMASYGYMQLIGEGCPVNKKNAYHYFRLSRQNMYYIDLDSKMLFNQSYVPDEYFDILQDYKKKTLDKQAAVLLNLGNLCYYGKGTDADKDEAMSLYKESADKGNTYAMQCYAKMIIKKQGPPKPLTEACKYLKMASDAGDYDAMCSYGEMFEDGIGVKKNHDEAYRYYKMAADSGNARGMGKLSWCYLCGISVPTDYNEAVRYSKMGSDKGDYESMANYGLCLEKGYGVKANRKEAQHYYQMAVDGGYNGCKSDLERVSSKSQCCNIC